MCPIDGLYDLHRHGADSSEHVATETTRLSVRLVQLR
jgi:hypothetical protein